MLFNVLFVKFAMWINTIMPLDIGGDSGSGVTFMLFKKQKLAFIAATPITLSISNLKIYLSKSFE